MRLVLLVLNLFIANFALGQNQISGFLKNKDGNPVEYANVLLFQRADTLKIFQGTTTDSSGHFNFSDIKKGEYLLKFHCIGHKANRIEIEKQIDKVLFLNTVVLEADITF